MQGLKDFVLHRLTLRVAYILAAFSSAKLIAFAASDKVQAVLSHAGVMLQVTDPDKLKAYIVSVVLIAGEFVFHWIDVKFIQPKAQKA